MNHKVVRLLIADNSEFLLQAIKMFFEKFVPDIAVTLAKTHEDVLKCLSEQEVDVVLLDRFMGGRIDMLNQLQVLKSTGTKAKIAIWTSFPDITNASQAIAEGFSGYIDKHQNLDDIPKFVHRLNNGEMLVIIGNYESSEHERFRSLSDLERKILCLYTRNTVIKTIAAECEFGENRIYEYLDKLRAVFELDHNEELKALALPNWLCNGCLNS